MISDINIDDEALRDRGLSHVGTSPKDPTLIIACGALAREILAMIKLNGWDHMSLQCLPAILHNTPQDIPQAIENAVEKSKNTYKNILIAYGDCGTGGRLDALCKRLSVTLIDAPHCYAFFDGVEEFSARGEVTSFYLTDFLARQFDAFVWKPLGLDRHPDLRDMYFGNYENLVYLAQTEDAVLTQTARECAARLGLKFERRFTGYGELADFLTPPSP